MYLLNVDRVMLACPFCPFNICYNLKCRKIYNLLEKSKGFFMYKIKYYKDSSEDVGLGAFLFWRNRDGYS